jgi:hypothetical protein
MPISLELGNDALLTLNVHIEALKPRRDIFPIGDCSRT